MYSYCVLTADLGVSGSCCSVIPGGLHWPLPISKYGFNPTSVASGTGATAAPRGMSLSMERGVEGGFEETLGIWGFNLNL